MSTPEERQRRCTCGHQMVEHRVVVAGLRAPQVGVCMVRGCGCTQWTPKEK